VKQKQRQPLVAFMAMRGISGRKVAAEIGLHRVTVERSLRCERPPNRRLVAWAVREFQLPAEVLFRQSSNGNRPGTCDDPPPDGST